MKRYMYIQIYPKTRPDCDSRLEMIFATCNHCGHDVHDLQLSYAWYSQYTTTTGARLEKDTSLMQDQVGALNIQNISYKSRWAFASFRAEHLARRYINNYAYIYMYTCMYIHIYIYANHVGHSPRFARSILCVSIYICKYIHMYAYILYIHICVYTYTHMQITLGVRLVSRWASCA